MQCLVNKPNEAYASATKRKILKILKCGEDQYTNACHHSKWTSNIIFTIHDRKPCKLGLCSILALFNS